MVCSLLPYHQFQKRLSYDSAISTYGIIYSIPSTPFSGEDSSAYYILRRVPTTSFWCKLIRSFENVQTLRRQCTKNIALKQRLVLKIFTK